MNLIKDWQLNYYNIFAYLFFVLFAIWAVVNAEARILISDPAYYLFNIINASDFFVPGTRQTAVINQIFVVLGVKLNLPLKLLIPLYSVSFVLLRILFFFIVNTVFKNKAAGFAIIAISVVGVAQSYYRPTSESTIAMLNSILLYAWLCYTDGFQKLEKWKSLVGFIGTVLLVLFGYFTHPVALFSLLFVIIYFSITTKKLKTVYPYLSVVITLAVFMFEVFLGSSNSHQSGLYANLLTSPLSIFSEIRGYYPYNFFDSRFNELYIPLSLLFFLGIAISARNRQWLAVLFFVLYSGSYFVVTCTSFKAGDSDMQMEKIFLPLVLFSALVFAESILKWIKNGQISLIIVVVLLAVNGSLKISKAGNVYNGRITYVKEIIGKANQQKNRKLVISKDQLNNPRMVFSWAMGIETLMITSMDKSIETLTVFTAPNLKVVEERMKQPDNFMPAPFQTSYNYNSLNKDYFVLPVSEYVIYEKDFR